MDEPEGMFDVSRLAASPGRTCSLHFSPNKHFPNNNALFTFNVFHLKFVLLFVDFNGEVSVAEVNHF